MSETRIIRVRDSIMSQNRADAGQIRDDLSHRGVLMINLMSSPGSGKTSLILATIAALAGHTRIGVIEADLDSTVDADKVIRAGGNAVQIETAGFCHVDANMVKPALDQLGSDFDLVLLENVGNLICTAAHDTGAHLNVAILSVPEGDDKPLKYPPMFIGADLVIISKIDYIDVSDFDVSLARERISVLNPSAPVIVLSCRTGDGVSDWTRWLEDKMSDRPSADLA